MIKTLPPGPLDLVGDVHGELGALRALLAAAGHLEPGGHPEGRRLVFLGDLVDRGPDSPGVLALVRPLVESGRADCLLGNHELNLLRGQRKSGSGWFWGEGAAQDEKYRPWAVLDDEPAREAALAFFDRLPLVLLREDLRVVHAAWQVEALQALDAPGAPDEPEGARAAFARWEARVRGELEAEGLNAAAAAEKAPWRHHLDDPTVAMPRLDAVARRDSAQQMRHPMRVLTSGEERPAARPFYASGQWRFCERVRWWDGYAEPTPVVVGHYWRQALPLDRAALDKGDPDLFEGTPPEAWLGPAGRVFCVDYAVGGRYAERRSGCPGARTRLALLRWPERELVFDTGVRRPTTGYGGPGPAA